MNKELPKVLIVSRGVWDDTKGTSSTLTNLFGDYDADKLAHIYIETIMPNTRCCNKFFQISEFSLVQKLYKWRTKTGFLIDIRQGKKEVANSIIAEKEQSVMNRVRKHRSIWFSFAREALWALNGWKSKELKQFIIEFDPDVIWMDGSPLVLMNRIYKYVLRIAKKPAVMFMMDDIYTYESSDSNLTAILYRWLLRKEVKKVMKRCDDMFVASPKMKREYDKFFGKDSTFIAKSIDISKLDNNPLEATHDIIRLVYLGQVIYGRIYSLIAIAEALAKVNKDGVKAQLYVYTNNEIPESLKQQLLVKDSVFLLPPVPYDTVPKIMAENDVVVFVESFDPRFCKVARLSFSTKICDYLSSGKCILAVGPADLAPIEYFKDEDAAIVVTSLDEIESQIIRLSNPQLLAEYIQKAKDCLVRNHSREKMNGVIYGHLSELSKAGGTNHHK